MILFLDVETTGLDLYHIAFLENIGIDFSGHSFIDPIECHNRLGGSYNDEVRKHFK